MAIITQHIQHQYHGDTFDIEYRRGHPRQKRIRLTLRRDGSILLSAPANSSNSEVEQFLHQHLDWLCDKKRQQQTKKPIAQNPVPRYIDGASHMLLGDNVTLSVSQSSKSDVKRQSNILIITSRDTNEENIESLFQQYCRRLAQSYFSARLHALLAYTPWVDNPPELRVRRMKRQWGNCAKRGHITLNQHLIKAPPACIDLVIIHELCHLKHFNHSPAFYALMDSTLPDWRQYHQQLKAISPST